LRWPVSMPEM